MTMSGNAMDHSRDFDDVQKAVGAALVSTTRTVTRISAEDISFFRSSSRIASQAVDDRCTRLLCLSEKLLFRSAFPRTTSHPRLRNTDAVDADWRKIVDGVDSLLERADITLDEYAGYFRRRNDDSREQSPVPKKSKFLPREFRNQNIAKPQLYFEHKPLNNQTEPFKPLLYTKPNAQIPLDVALSGSLEDGYQHPYQQEIENYQYPSSVQTIAHPVDPRPFATTNATFVDDMDGVRTMLAALKQANEIAIDLEHHDTHSYIGLVSLMQISTRDNDWIVDTLKPWRRELQVLNEVFTNPCIIKVLHGAQMDAIWLQRDLGLYLVGLFDTYHAARVLGYTGHGLAFLLKKFVNFDAQKQYQTADWRIRPLPMALFDYARSDTHFLLYIYDNMKNELIERSTAKHDKLQDVLIRSKEYALQRYEHPFYCDLPRKSTNGWFNLLCRTPINFTDLQLAVFREIHRWRDVVARAEDESTNYVLANHVLYNIARAMPTDRSSLLRLSGNISNIVRSRLDELLNIIADTEADPGSGQVIRLAIETALNTTLSDHVTSVDPNPALGQISDTTIAPPAEPLRMSISGFWGSSSSSGSLKKGSSSLDLFGLTLSRSHDNLELIAAPQYSPAVEPDMKKRKQHGVVGDSSIVSGGSSIIGQNMATTSGVAARDDAILGAKLKSERGAMKLQMKSELVSASDAEVEAFNYEEAASMFQSGHHGPRRGKKSQRAEFNPYAMAAEASSGLGRAQNFRTGRTSTFK